MSRIEMRIIRPDKDNPVVSTTIEAVVQHEWMMDAHAIEAIKTLSQELLSILSKGEATE